jgi:SpoVK/Ycf46/Vps4 family AAA+-type ATPase
LLIGHRGVGKRLLAKSLATQTGSGFLCVAVPKLVLEIMHEAGKAGELLSAWSHALDDMPRLTILFNELEFSQAQEIGARRPDLPIGPVMDFLLNLVDRAVAAESHLVVGSTSHPNTLRQAFVQPGRFERVVEVSAEYPADLVEALVIHAANSEQRASERLFDEVDWKLVVERYREPVAGDWIRIMHAVLRRKARCEAAGESTSLVTTQNLQDEVDRFRQAIVRLSTTEGGNYV